MKKSCRFASSGLVSSMGEDFSPHRTHIVCTENAMKVSIVDASSSLRRIRIKTVTTFKLYGSRDGWIDRPIDRSTDRAETFTKISTRPTMISGLLDGNRFFFSKIRSMKCANSPSYYNVEWMFCRSHYMEREFLCDAKPNVPAKEQFAYPE